jgi:hypothetical protein
MPENKLPPAGHLSSTGIPMPQPSVRVSFGPNPAEMQNLAFDRPFRIGRVAECDVCIRNEYVSRAHAEVVFENGQWWVRDLGSGNGIFVGDRKIQSTPLGNSLTIRLGVAGPTVTLQVQQAPVGMYFPKPDIPPSQPATPVSQSPVQHSSEAVPSETQYIQRYFGKTGAGEAAGEHTVMVRRAYARVHTKQQRNYAWIIGALLLLIGASGGYAFYLHRQASKNKALAQDLFYSMKSLDVDIANIEKLVADSNGAQGSDEVRRYQTRRKQMEQNYDRFLTALHVYDPTLTQQQRLILRVARVFGESEIAMPPGFTAEVEKYIAKWQGSGRFARAIGLAKEKGYAALISREFLAQDLPPQFFYLALQESDFDPYISGPMTRKGIAKGMWQFIPETGVKYGLQIGPLVDLPRPDPADDRHHYDRATKAAARYIKDLYSTDAQASGLLVMACYNWGDNQVLPLVRGMAADPRDRNFWQLLTKYRDKIPQETYDYVFYIVSAAVIGENPRLFGFDFDNPLLSVEGR